MFYVDFCTRISISRNDRAVLCLTRFEYTNKKGYTLYILILCVVGRQVRDGGANCSAKAYANRNPGLIT